MKNNLLILCFILLRINAIAQNNIVPESPIRFQVEIDTNYPGLLAPPNYEKDWGVLILPKQYSMEGKPVPLVIGCHGGGGTVNASGSQTETLESYRFLISLGYAVLDMSGMPETYSNRKKIDHFRTLGSYVALRSYESGYKWVVSHYNIDKNGCFVTGGSNGGLISSNIVLHTSIPVIAQAGMSPLLSIKEDAWNISSGAISGGQFNQYQNRANIIRIYDMKAVNSLNELLLAQYEDEKVGIFDPLAFVLDSLKQKKYPCPVKFWHPVNDPSVNIKFSRQFISEIKNSGGNAFLVELPDGQHSPEYYGLTLKKFIYAGNYYDLKQPVLELAEWFGQFSGIKADVTNLTKLTNNDDGEFSIFPNPFSEEFAIAGIQSDKEFYFRIFDLNGKIIYSSFSNGISDRVNLSKVPKGLYMVTISQNLKIKTIKIIKE